MFARVTTVAFEGIEARPVDVQVQIGPGLPAFAIVGLPDKAVVESRERVRGALNAIVHSHAARLADFPEVPTFKEMGIDLVATTWFTISGPAKLPPDIVAKMNREIVAAVSKPEVQQRLRHDGLIAEAISVEQLKAYIDAETARWKPVLEQAGLIGK